MNPTTLNVVQGDSLYNLNFTLQNNAGVAINLTGATVALKVQKQEESAVKFTGAMVIDTPLSGICHYVVQATDFDEVGTYYAEIVITFASTEVLTFPNITILATAKLPIL